MEKRHHRPTKHPRKVVSIETVITEDDRLTVDADPEDALRALLRPVTKQPDRT